MLPQRAFAFASETRFLGPLDTPPTLIGRGGADPGEGKYCQLWIKLDNDVIRKICFQTNGCPSSVAAASALCTLIEGRELIRARTLTSEELLRFIGGLPEGAEDAAERAIAALKNAREVEING